MNRRQFLRRTSSVVVAAAPMIVVPKFGSWFKQVFLPTQAAPGRWVEVGHYFKLPPVVTFGDTIIRFPGGERLLAEPVRLTKHTLSIEESMRAVFAGPMDRGIFSGLDADLGTVLGANRPLGLRLPWD